ncbi:hypothetical protein JKP88DRAFT_279189 [Tribonema minus]|uniref:Uncharacterized protein n=1 Tax=Tribonema minus TaxID=303371 RepID=A0A835YUP1_9STRA|nr:hypothetical protein JKP88DRAFT_279189 [Tribonema minus]
MSAEQQHQVAALLAELAAVKAEKDRAVAEATARAEAALHRAVAAEAALEARRGSWQPHDYANSDFSDDDATETEGGDSDGEGEGGGSEAEYDDDAELLYDDTVPGRTPQSPLVVADAEEVKLLVRAVHAKYVDDETGEETCLLRYCPFDATDACRRFRGSFEDAAPARDAGVREPLQLFAYGEMQVSRPPGRAPPARSLARSSARPRCAAAPSVVSLPPAPSPRPVASQTRKSMYLALLAAMSHLLGVPSVLCTHFVEARTDILRKVSRYLDLLKAVCPRLAGMPVASVEDGELLRCMRRGGVVVISDTPRQLRIVADRLEQLRRDEAVDRRGRRGYVSLLQT